MVGGYAEVKIVRQQLVDLGASSIVSEYSRPGGTVVQIARQKASGGSRNWVECGSLRRVWFWETQGWEPPFIPPAVLAILCIRLPLFPLIRRYFQYGELLHILS